jgi:hypothetical protein
MSKHVIILLGLALVASSGCAEGEPATSNLLAGTLSVDIRGTATISIERQPGGTAKITLSVDETGAAGLFDAATPLSLAGRIEAFPENESELYTAKTSLAASPAGACGSEPVSLALSLHKRGKNARVGGALTAYCGKDRFHGVPARLLRLSGELAAR